MKKVILCLMAAFFLQPAWASNAAREIRMAEEIVDAILDGDAEMLTADGNEFLSIYTEAEQARGAVVIMHGRGFHPDWIDAVKPLRVGLVEHGWNTLSIQMPVLDKTAKYYDYEPIFPEATPRIKAAIDFLRQKGNQKIILLAHSCGAHMAMQYVRTEGDKNFDAYVGIGMGATDFQQPMRQPFPLDKISKPMLDVYGSDDYPAVQRMAPIRLHQLRIGGHPYSQQIVIPRADHYFTDQGRPLVEAVSRWLESI